MIALEQMAEIAIAVVLVVGGVFGLIGSFGLLKLRLPMQRLHAPTKATTIGVGTALVASMLNHWFLHATPSFQELLIVAFLLLTAPVTTLFLAKAHLHLTVHRTEVPPTGTKAPWATFSTDDSDEFRT
jgi:multicomponent K+:H+ antiporter subunit G